MAQSWESHGTCVTEESVSCHLDNHPTLGIMGIAGTLDLDFDGLKF